MQAQNSPLIVVYHEDCIDGAASAWIIAKAHSAENPDLQGKVTYIPYTHADKGVAEDKIRASLSSNAKVYFVDITPEKYFLDELISFAGSIHILDHHQSAVARLDGYKNTPKLEILLDPAAASASKMIWQHFFPKEKAPAVIDLINLMDGGSAGLKTPQDFAAAALVDSQDIRTTERAFKTLHGLAKLSFNDMAKKGKHIAADQEAKIDKLLENAPLVKLQLLPETDPVDVPIVNADIRHFGRAISERLVDLGKKNGVNAAFIWSMQKNGAVSMSIRTDGNPDASKIAEHLCKTMGATGGGHKDAAAVHFSSLFEFARHMPIKAAKPADIKPGQPKYA